MYVCKVTRDTGYIFLKRVCQKKEKGRKKETYIIILPKKVNFNYKHTHGSSNTIKSSMGDKIRRRNLWTHHITPETGGR